MASILLAVVASFSALGGFIFGYDLGLIGGALLGISADLGITASMSQSGIVGALKLGSFLGAFVGGALMLRYGRRKALAVCSFFGVLGPLVMAGAYGVGLLVAGRAISGLGIGACAIIVPAYLAEVAPASHRGAIVQVYEMMLCVGLLVSTLVNWGLSHLGSSTWRLMVGLPAVPGALLAGSLLMLPESPRWLVMHGDLDSALETIQKVLGRKHGDTTLDVSAQEAAAIARAEDELLLLWSSVEKDKHTVLDRQREVLHKRRKQQQLQQRAQALHVVNVPCTATAGDSLAVRGGGGVQGEGEAGQAEPLLRLSDVRSSAEADLAPGSATCYMPAKQQGEELQGSLKHPCISQPHHELTAHKASSPRHCATATHNQQHSGHDRPRPIPQLHPQLETSEDVQSGWGAVHALTPREDRSKSRRKAHTNESTHTKSISCNDAAPGVPQLPVSKAAEDRAAEDRAAKQKLLGGEECRSDHALPDQARRGGSSTSDSSRHSSLDDTATAAASKGHRGSMEVEGGFRSSLELCVPPGACLQEADHHLHHHPAELPGHESNFFKTFFNMLIDIYAVARAKEARAFRLACLLAIFNQATASTAIINYAPTLLQRMSTSLTDTQAQLFLAAIALTKVVGVGIGMCTVDNLGRRPLLLGGAAGCAVTMGCATAAYQASSTNGLLACMCAFVLAFSISWAGVYWVVVSECFSMSAKSPATSFATALLFLAGGLVDLVFQLLVNWLEGFCLLVFAGIAIGSGVYVWMCVPETKGQSLSTVQAIINRTGSGNRVAILPEMQMPKL